MAPGLLLQGLELMLFGMGTVLAFLTLLILVTTLMSRLAQRLELPASESPVDAASGQPSKPVLAAIAAAIHAHREMRSKSK